MGGWMTYGRMRHRNGLEWRSGRPGQLYPGDAETELPAVVRGLGGLLGDLNRMEQDYLTPVYPKAPFALRPADSDPSAECAAATGVDVPTVRRVLAYVFRESR